MELLWGGGCLLAFYWVACMVGHGYANTVDSIALFLHDHAENVKRMHSAREAQIRSRWIAGGRRPKPTSERRPASNQPVGRPEAVLTSRLASVEKLTRSR
jgi:hypothetical protein